MEYRELAPVPELACAIECIWLLQGDSFNCQNCQNCQDCQDSLQPQAILPDGRPELVLHFGDRFERVSRTGDRVLQPAMIYAGQVTSPLLLRPTGRVAVLGVRFRPHGAAALFDVPQHELTGLTLEVEGLSGKLRRDLAELEDCAGDLGRAAAAVQRLLRRWIRPERIDPRVAFAVGAVERARGRLSVGALAGAVGITPRHLERQFLAAVGISPKRLTRLARFQHALATLQNSHAGHGAETAAACGYADQSHFIRDFRQLAGSSPSEHLLNQAELTGFFIERR